MFQPEKQASVPAIWTYTSKKQKYGFKKPRFFLSEGPESWYKFCRILQQVSQILAQVPIHALTIPVEVVPARTPAHALKELVLFEKHKFH